jgi:transcriptional regulator with XRE-family HTH domain
VTDRAVVPWRVELGRRLRYERDARGWSRPQLAARLRSAPGDDHPPEVRQLTDMVKQWERGLHAPNDDYQRRYCHVFSMDIRVLFAELHGAEPPSPWSVPDPRLSPDDVERLELAVARPARVDGAVVESLGVVLAEQRRLEDGIGSAPVLLVVRAQLGALRGLVTGARGPMRPALVDVAAQWAQFEGWLNIATGDAARARTSLDRAAEHANEIGDADMVGTVMSWRAHLAERLGQVGPMIGMAAAARRDRRGPGHAYDVFQEARGHALAGDQAAALRLLGEARDEVEAADAERARPWEYYYLEPGFFTLETGLTYLYLGELDKRWTGYAVEHLTSGLESLPAGMRRSEWAGEFRYQLGRAYLQGEEAGQAAALAHDLSAMADDLGSSQLAERVAELETMAAGDRPT